MIFDRIGRWGLKMKLHVIIAVLSFFISTKSLKAQELKEAKQEVVALKKEPTKSGFDLTTKKMKITILPLIKKEISDIRKEGKVKKGIEKIRKFEKAVGIKKSPISINISIKMGVIAKIKEFLSEGINRNFILLILGKKIEITKERISEIKSSNPSIGRQVSVIWKIIEEKLSEDDLAFR